MTNERRFAAVKRFLPRRDDGRGRKRRRFAAAKISFDTPYGRLRMRG
jgi:hypothetical protein